MGFDSSHYSIVESDQKDLTGTGTSWCRWSLEVVDRYTTRDLEEGEMRSTLIMEMNGAKEAWETYDAWESWG